MPSSVLLRRKHRGKALFGNSADLSDDCCRFIWYNFASVLQINPESRLASTLSPLRINAVSPCAGNMKKFLGSILLIAMLSAETRVCAQTNGTTNGGEPKGTTAGTTNSANPALPTPAAAPSPGKPLVPNDGTVPLPPPGASLDQLYPEPKTVAPYSASGTDPTLSEKQRKEAEEIPLSPIPASELLSIGGGRLPPIKLEATFNEGITLKEVLQITARNNLPIRISQAGYDSQRYLFLGALGRFAPDFTITYRGQTVESGSNTSTIFTDSTTVRYPVFQGGRVLYGSLVQYYRMRASKNLYYASVNDALLDAYRRYFDLVLNQTLLQIRVKSVELSRSQLKLNEQLRDAGVGTNFAVYQSRTQLALDKQALLQQQVVFRQSALELSRVLNTSMAINFIPEQSSVRELRLIDPETPIETLLAATMKLRPELKQFEDLRLAAARNVPVAASPLYPSFQFFTSTTSTRRPPQGNASSGGGSSGGSSSGSSNNANTNSLAGSTVIVPTGGAGGGIGISGGSGARSYSYGFDLSWALSNMGLPDLGNTLSARALARQALLQSNQTYINTIFEVRRSYLNMLTAKEQVQVAAEALVSSSEELRLANLRVTYGQGINLELIQAQRNYVTALSNHVTAIIGYNVSQAQLLRDTGQISLNRLTQEYPRKIGIRKPDAVITQ